MKTLNFAIGNSDFKEIIQMKTTLVDKTLLLKEIMEDASKVILITRPRRFGKTINMSMMSYFFGLTQESEADIFQGLKIKDHPEFCARHQHKYPVIFLSFKDIKFETFEDAIDAVKGLFADLYSLYRGLLEGDVLFEEEKEYFRKVIRQEVNGPSELGKVLATLMSYLHKKHGVPVILLIDEYDTPIQEAYIKGYYTPMVGFMRSLLGLALKDNKNLQKAVLTGITRISQESMFSGLNNVRVYTVLDEGYGQYFGFTEDEVLDLLPQGEDIAPITKWYNGYRIGGYQLYNPWSITNYFASGCKFDIYWVSTSNNLLVRELIEAKPALREQFEELVQGIPKRKILEKNLVFPDLKTSADAVWTLLIHAGYLHATSVTIDEQAKTRGDIAIPNREILGLYISMIERWFIPPDAETQEYENFIDSLSQGKIDQFTKYIEYCLSSLSYFDMDKRTPEKIYHTFVAGIFMRMNHAYDISSNKEAGDGRYDVRITPKDPTKRGFLLEFKTAPKQENLEKAATNALDQIIQKDYTKGMKSADVLCLGLAFCGGKVVGKHMIMGSL